MRQGILLQVVERDSHAQKSGHKSSRSLAFGGVYRLGGGGASSGQQLQPIDCDDHQQRSHSGGLFNNYFASMTGHGQDHDKTAKELVRQCFLFTNHLLLCTRTKDGKLRLLEVSSSVCLSLLFRLQVQSPPEAGGALKGLRGQNPICSLETGTKIKDRTLAKSV